MVWDAKSISIQELEGGWRLFESQQFLLEVPPGYEFVDSPPPDTRSLGAQPFQIEEFFTKIRKYKKADIMLVLIGRNMK